MAKTVQNVILDKLLSIREMSSFLKRHEEDGLADKYRDCYSEATVKNCHEIRQLLLNLPLDYEATEAEREETYLKTN